MELNLGLKITQTRDDVSSSTDFQFSKDPFGPLFFSRETNAMFILFIHLKGFKREGIEIEINKEGNRVKISGRKSVQEMVLIKWKPWKKEVELRSFTKVFRIPEIVDLDKIKARFDEERWTLTITMPKKVKGIIGLEIEEEKEDEEEREGGLEDVKEPAESSEEVAGKGEERGKKEEVEEENIERGKSEEILEKFEEEIVEEEKEQEMGHKENGTDQEETEEVIGREDKGTQVPEESERASSEGVEEAEEVGANEGLEEKPPEEEPEKEEEMPQEVGAEEGVEEDPSEEEPEKMEEKAEEEEKIVEYAETKTENDNLRNIQEIEEQEPDEPENQDDQEEIQEQEEEETSEDEDEGEEWQGKVTEDSSEDIGRRRRKRKNMFSFPLVAGSALVMSLILIVIHLIGSKRKSD